MKKLLTIILLIPILNFGQSEKSYLELIDEAKTKKNSSEIEKLIIGTWEFQKLTDKNGKIISQRNHVVNDTITALENIWRPSMQINKNGTYKLIGCENPTNCETGKWIYDKEFKLFRMIYDKPKYNVPIDRVSPELLEKLKKSGTLKEFTKNEIEFVEITENELKVFDLLPSDGTELKYNILVYKKK
ncbi:hypothetical protein [Formosa sp. A9]|uniref:hypothetical protein n=1 Tax=Formosa sp. A9 TaxID=3442641 RepID=UPI003EBF3FF4